MNRRCCTLDSTSVAEARSAHPMFLKCLQPPTNACGCRCATPLAPLATASSPTLARTRRDASTTATRASRCSRAAALRRAACSSRPSRARSGHQRSSSSTVRASCSAFGGSLWSFVLHFTACCASDAASLSVRDTKKAVRAEMWCEATRVPVCSCVLYAPDACLTSCPWPASCTQLCTNCVCSLQHGPLPARW